MGQNIWRRWRHGPRTAIFQNSGGGSHTRTGPAPPPLPGWWPGCKSPKSVHMGGRSGRDDYTHETRSADIVHLRPQTGRRGKWPVRQSRRYGQEAVGPAVWRRKRSGRVRGLQALGDGCLCLGSGPHDHGNATDHETDRSSPQRRKGIRVYTVAPGPAVIRGRRALAAQECGVGSPVGAFSHSARTARAQRAHSVNDDSVYPRNTPASNPPTEACMIHSKRHQGCSIQDPGTRGYRGLCSI